MEKIIGVLTILAICSGISSNQCPRDEEVGNPISWAKIFCYEKDWEWDYYNVNTQHPEKKYFIYHESVDLGGGEFRHVIIYKITQKPDSGGERSYFYVNDVVFDANEIFQRTLGYARVKAFKSNLKTVKTINKIIKNSTSTTTPPVNIDDLLLDKTSAITELEFGACNDWVRLEKVYFEYLFTNYYKQGKGKTIPKNPYED